MLNQHELFEKLLEQLEWQNQESESLFATAELNKLIVHRKSHKWQFEVKLDQIMPFDLFNQFNNQLINQFKTIADVELRVIPKDNQFNERLLKEYWQWAVLNSGVKSALINELCNDHYPEMMDSRIVFMAENEIVKNFLTTQILGPVEEAYQRAGFPKFNIKTLVDESKSQEKITEIKKKIRDRNIELVKNANQAIKQNQEQKRTTSRPASGDNLTIGKKIKSDLPVMPLVEIVEEERSVVVEGYIFDKEIRVLKSGRQLLILKVTDYTSSISVKKFSGKGDEELFETINQGDWVKIRGSIQEDNYSHELTLNAMDINPIKKQQRKDTAPDDEKRVELHLHTNMSQMDATNNIGDFVKQAKKWGHPAIAITDHSGVQGFPDAYNSAKKNDIKMIYGVEVNLVDDGVPITYNDSHTYLKDATYVVFDVETTGLSAIYDRVIELSAVKMVNGNVIDQFEEFIDPGFHLSEQTTELTSITDEMVRGSKSEEEVFANFREFYGDAIIVGHNVTFDIGFMNAGYQRQGKDKITNPIIDTLTLARFLYPTLKGYRLNTLAKKFDVNLEHHHRAVYDAETTGHLNQIFITDAKERYDIEYHDQLNEHMSDNGAYRHARPAHAILLAQTQAGLKNMFKIVSSSNVDYFYRVPRVPKTLLTKYREGILVGSACSGGEVFTAMMQKGMEEARQKAAFYDYLEIQAKRAYEPLIKQEMIADNEKLEEILQNIVDLGAEMNKKVVATGDVHYLNQEDYIYRKILINSQGGANPLNRQELPDLHFLTTDEMLAELSFLGADKAKEVVVTNSNYISDQIEEIHPLKDKLYTPKMEGAEDQIQNKTMQTAYEMYGNPLPEIVSKRLDKELKSIIGNGFSVIYLIAKRLVDKSNKDGYLVGSRGSVGSSLVATLTGITEVNPLPPHYRCPNCQHTEFFTKGEYSSGYDLPEKRCPECDTLMIGDGHDIPFETFLGFTGNKVPDIDLNFSGDYQPIAHNYTKVLFGEKNVFRAGTIGTVADKTAYGYVKAYERDKGQVFRSAEEDRLAKGATGVKRTTGQHPAGIIVVPDYMDIYDFTPIQFPADDKTAAWKTTHFDFHSIHDNILKIDILGHDDPTMIRMLQDLSGIDPQTIPMDDPGVMSIFSSPEILGVTPEAIQSKTGTLGVPEFGTRFVRGMLEQTHPKNYSELLQISGLSHGTDVWIGNADELIKNGTATIANVIGCRDNIMTDLIHWGLDSELSFQIMEKVRKGKGISDEWQQSMRDADIPEWYIDSCLKIKYMFPRAHAAAYILMALRIAYFKVYFPIVYYAAYFSVRADDFDIVSMSRGKEAVKNAMKEINDKGMEASTKEKNLLTVLELANEMLERGFEFKMVDLDKSVASEWLIEGNTLIAPFDSVPGLGLNVAKQIVAAREDKPFISKEDLSKRGKVSKSLIEFMTDNGILAGLPDENQLSLF